ncbi:DNA alkylation repair protein [Pseudochrobactrum sp. sp1633]|uniref:DNA alkylation repair protein n=1 Tax=Pseudochrobactrum sp. sp1633 TaxID=3036706 RepID=UPI0025A5B756|nr:DNA alkylation repair protein [Pseudochrobactrum sp. sp1633]MDM8345674.1 DNA alkylation repair protein [Pseudochrobactrum sp. sp1633]HWD12377.1 DNA alkylation repair protein [Pseudochrobactrum sp.]
MTKAPVKSVRRMSDITPERLADLNSGIAETTVLTECLAIDFAQLMKTAFPDTPAQMHQEMAAPATGFTARMALAAQLLHDHGKTNLSDLNTHSSDTIRGWACYFIAQQQHFSLHEKLEQIRPLADDHHFGVREWAWLALRNDLIAEPELSFTLLQPWTNDPSYKIRRYACEAVRPRGVWCAHFNLLKTQPELALTILEALRSDPEIYVQDSVANWLNDASKTTPDWVQSLCNRWQQESSSPATTRICKRALRTINK